MGETVTVVEDASKPVWKSKTFWTNVVGSLAVVGSLFGLDLSAEEQQAVVTLALAAFPVVNVILRLVTNKPVTLTSNKSEKA